MKIKGGDDVKIKGGDGGGVTDARWGKLRRTPPRPWLAPQAAISKQTNKHRRVFSVHYYTLKYSKAIGTTAKKSNALETENKPQKWEKNQPLYQDHNNPHNPPSPPEIRLAPR